MSDSKAIIAVLDANVLYPAPLRDFLLRIAETGMFIPKWSDEIHEEWTRNLLAKRPDIKPIQLRRTCHFMEQAFEEANVKSYKSLVNGLVLPDPDDRHVLAVAIKSKASTIITFNKRDFPVKAVKPYGVEVLHPDEFIIRLLNNNLSKVLESFQKLLNSLRKPPQTSTQLLTTLEKNALPKSTNALRDALKTTTI